MDTTQGLRDLCYHSFACLSTTIVTHSPVNTMVRMVAGCISMPGPQRAGAIAWEAPQDNGTRTLL